MRHRKITPFFLSLCLAFLSCQSKPELEAPRAKIVPQKLETLGQVRTDNYYWLRDRKSPEVIAYLKSENDYTSKVMAHTAGLQEKLFQEFKARIRQTDVSVPYKKDDYYYYSRVEEGKDYPIYCRKKGSAGGPEEIMLDVNRLAQGHEYYNVSSREVSSGEDILAYTVDTVGRRISDIHFKNLRTGEELKDIIPQVTAVMAWANDDKTLFYVKQDPVTLRYDRIYRHVLGSDPAKDDSVYEEKDDTFYCFIQKTKSKKYLLIGSEQTLSSEYRYLDADKPTGQFKVFLPRQRDHEYSLDHYQDNFYIRTNHDAKNFRLLKTPVAHTEMKNWQEVIPHRDDVLLEDIEISKDYLLAIERKDGLVRFRVMPWAGKSEHYLDFGEPAYQAEPIDNYDFNSPWLRYSYSSLTTPDSIYDYNMATREKKLLKREEVLAGFDPANYQSERIHATAADGARVPISLVYRKDQRKPGANPLLLYGYGSYGFSIDSGFDPFRISFLDRGFVYAIAHIRGGEELGRQWYEDGKLLKKKNTFTDFIACGEELVEQKYADPERLYAQGASAGGLLMGAVVNMRPDLFRGVIAGVPFVDVVTTMLDKDLPLTTSEYDEWGNPNDKTYYDYILSYSPYDQVETKNYPNMLVLTSLPDSQVQYWEPAKWVAKLRALKTDKNLLLLKTRFDASHGGASGRDDRYREEAFKLAFLLDLAGIKQ